MYDIIGDIHGHANQLERLLAKLGYRAKAGVYQHSERKAVFLGDLIDRGPQIPQVLDIVRRMVDSGHALAVIGNHELNALAFHTPDVQGEYLRPHNEKNVRQHRATMEQLDSALLQEYLKWFRTLPLWLELDGLRAVHACWCDQSMTQIRGAHSLSVGITNDFLASACRKSGALYKEVEIVLKGREIPLPAGASFFDKNGAERKEIRTRWYLPPDGHTYCSYALQTEKIECDLKIDNAAAAKAVPYSPDEKPVFVGHYWLSAQRPEVLAENVACLDFSVAKGGLLCAYRWQGERKLSNDHFVWVSG
jgi:hypothetical protein